MGEILKAAGVRVVHEPLNRRFGMQGVSIAYPYAEFQGESHVRLVDDAVTMSRPWNRSSRDIQARGLRKIAFKLTGGRSGLRWSALRMRKWLGMPHASVCMKDPFMSLATPWLVGHHGLKAICLVRHPAGIHYSTGKQSWRFSVNNLRQQSELIERYGSDITDTQWDMAEEYAAASIAVLWKLMWRVNHAFARRDDRLKLVTHESLCLQPLQTVQSICEHFDIAFTPALDGFVREHSMGGRVEAEDGRTHDFKRDSRAIPDVWRGKISKDDEAMIQAIAGRDVESIYGSWQS